MGSINFPDNELVLVIRPSLNAICYKVRPAAKLLSFLCYQYKNNKNPQLDEQGGFTVVRTQAELVEVLCDEMDVKTLHDTAIPWLMFLGYIDLIENTGTKANHYILYPGRVNAALAVHKQPKMLAKLLSAAARLELFLIDETPASLEKLLISDKKKFQSTLEKVRIYYRTFSNHTRGRKPAVGAAPEGEIGAPKIKDKDKINKDKKERTSTPSTQSSSSLSLSSAEEITEGARSVTTITERYRAINEPVTPLVEPVESLQEGSVTTVTTVTTSCNKEMQLREWIKQEKVICPKDQALVSEYVKALAPITSREQLHRLKEKALSEIQGPIKKVFLGNMVGSLDAFLDAEKVNEQFGLSPSEQPVETLPDVDIEALAAEIWEEYPELQLGMGPDLHGNMCIGIFHGDKDNDYIAVYDQADWLFFRAQKSMVTCLEYGRMRQAEPIAMEA